MKITTLIALSLSLALSACTAAGPTIANQAPGQTSAAPQRAGARESLRIKLPDFGRGFSTKAAYYEDLEEIRFYVEGQGLSNSETEDTETEVDVDLAELGEGDVSIEEIPANDGDWRVVTAVGLDSAGNELPAFTAKAVYISDEDSTIDISFSRASLLLGLGFEELIDDDSEILDDLDEDDLEELEDDLVELLNYDSEANRFRPEPGGGWVDPFDYDPADIAAAIEDDEIADLEPNGPFNVEISLDDDGSGTSLTGDVVVTIDDPDSQPVAIPAGTLITNATPDFKVSPGTWQAIARDASGNELDTIEFTVDQSGDIDFDSSEVLVVPTN